MSIGAVLLPRGVASYSCLPPLKKTKTRSKPFASGVASRSYQLKPPIINSLHKFNRARLTGFTTILSNL